MPELPDNVDLQWVGLRLIAIQDDLRGLRRDTDMLTRIVLRLDTTVDALREDVKSLWLNQRDLRERLERAEGRPP